jgi:SAM-dependent methyltransferase
MKIRPPHQHIFTRILSRWATCLPANGLILDIGCGLGAWIEVSSPHRRVVGLDIDQQACAIAASRVGNMATGIVLYGGGALPFKNGSFQGAYAHEVIEHVHDDQIFLAEVQRVLKAGGALLLTTPNGRRESLDKRKHGAHVRHYLPEQLSARLTEQDFEIQNRYWRIHPLCGLLDDTLSQIGNRLLKSQALQPGLTHWTSASQSGLSRVMLTLFKMIEPVISLIVLVEFELFKTTWEARNMIFIVQKRA